MIPGLTPQQEQAILAQGNLPKRSDRSAEVWHVEDEDRSLYGPSVDVCAWCADCECDGIGCIASLDSDDEQDHPAIEQLHAWIRRGRYMEMVERVLDENENRPVRPKHGSRL